MPARIDNDRARFREIVRGRIRRNLRKYVTEDELIGRKGKELVSIPLPQVDIPHFRFGKNAGGVGQGEGEPGQPLGPGDPHGQAGSDPGQHVLEVEVSLEELAAILGDELQLPRIEPKGDDTITEQRARYRSIRRVGPESLRHFKRTYVAALRRQLSEGVYSPAKPRVVPIKEDRRYRSWECTPEPRVNAAVIYMMDVSGSMSDQQKNIVRTTAFWIDTWLSSQYDGVERRYIIHDAAAKVVDEHTFYHTRENGGTRISSAYEACGRLMQDEFPFASWNVYCFQFSDGDNWGDDTKKAIQILAKSLVPNCNLFAYGQVDSPYGSGNYLKVASRILNGAENGAAFEINDRDDIYECLQCFLGKGV